METVVFCRRGRRATVGSGRREPHSGGPHEAGWLVALAHVLTSWHHLAGATVVAVAVLALARAGRGARIPRRGDR